MTEEKDRQRLPPRRRREQILDAATEAFGESGFRGTSLADVAARVGVSQPGLLHHYPTKQALILAVLEKRDEEDTRYLEAVFGDREYSLKGWLATLCEHNARRPALVRLYTVTSAESLDPSHPAHAFFKERYARIQAVVAERVRADQRRGLLPGSLDPEATAAGVIALMDGLQLQWLMRPETDMCGILGAHLDMLGMTDPTTP